MLMKKRLIFESIFVLVLLSISLYLIANVSGYSFLDATTNVTTTPVNGTYLKNSTTQYINCTANVIYVPGTTVNVTFRNASLFVTNTTNGSVLSTNLIWNQTNGTATSTTNFMYNGSMAGNNNGTSNLSIAVTWNINQTFIKPGPWIYNCQMYLNDIGQLAGLDPTTAQIMNKSANTTIVMDWYKPNVTKVGPVNSSGLDPDTTWSDGANVNFTVTATDENIANCSLYGDFTGEWARNKTVSVGRGVQADVAVLNLPSNSTGYRWAIGCEDLAGWFTYNQTLGYGTNTNSNSTTVPTNAYLLRVDDTAPSITLTPSASKTITLGAIEAVKCEQSDNAGAGTVTLTIGGASQTCDEGQGKGTCTSSYVAASTGAFEMKCVASDVMGNGLTKTITLTVEDNAPPGPTGPGPTGPGPTTPTDEIIAITPEPVAVQPFTNEPFTISVQGTTYPVEVTGVTATTATISTGSSSNTYTIGESKEIDLNNDGTSDLEVTLSDINLGRAVFSIKEVEVSIPGEAGTEVGTEEATTKKASTGVILGIIAAIIVILAGLYYFTRKR